ARAVEAEPILEDAFIQGLGGNGEMLPQAGEIHETHIDALDFLLANQCQNFFRGHVRQPPIISCFLPTSLPVEGKLEGPSRALCFIGILAAPAHMAPALPHDSTEFINYSLAIVPVIVITRPGP